MIQLELLNRPRPPQIPLERLAVLNGGINPSKPLFEALAEGNGLRFGGIKPPPMTWERLINPDIPPRPSITWERLLTLPETPPKPVISIALPGQLNGLVIEDYLAYRSGNLAFTSAGRRKAADIAEAFLRSTTSTEPDLTKLHPAEALMQKVLDSAALRINQGEQAGTRAMEWVPAPYVAPQAELAAARQILQHAVAMPTSAPIPEARPAVIPGSRISRTINAILTNPGLDSAAVFIAANELAKTVSFQLEGRLPIDPLLTFFGVHLLALGYLGLDTFIDNYRAQAQKDAQLALVETVRKLPRRYLRHAVAAGTWNVLTALGK